MYLFGINAINDKSKPITTRKPDENYGNGHKAQFFLSLSRLSCRRSPHSHFWWLH